MTKLAFSMMGAAVLFTAAIIVVGSEPESRPQRSSAGAHAPASPSVDPVSLLEAALASAAIGPQTESLPPRQVEAPFAHPQLRSVFERSMMYTGERPMSMIMSDLERQIELRLPASQVAAGKILLEKYARYRTESAMLENAIETATTAPTMRRHITSIRDLRVRLFNEEERAALFPNDDAYEDVLFARLEIRTSATLSEEEKEARASALEASLSPELVAAEAVRNKIVRLED